jgi:enoyl-CoA hydratase
VRPDRGGAVSELLTIAFDDGILRVTLNRPEKRNALSRPLLAEIARAFSDWSPRAEVVAAVLTGAGDKAFASGGDLDELNAIRTEADALAFSHETRAALDAVRHFPAPVIAVLNGDALGGGAELALACDLRIAAAHARIGFLQARLAITTAWGGGPDLFRLVGPSRALELLCTAELLDARRALALGLVEAVAADGESGAEFAASYVARFAARKPQVTRAFKSLAMLHRAQASPADKAAAESAGFARAWAHDDHWAEVEAMGRNRR